MCKEILPTGRALVPAGWRWHLLGMRIVGHGIDIVEIEHFRRLCQNGSDDALARSFTRTELAYSAEGADRAERLAGRFAAKEAVLKALGVGWTHEIAWTDIEVSALSSGAPTVTVRAGCADVAAERGVTSWLVSISHTSTVAMASVIALSDSVMSRGEVGESHGHAMTGDTN